MNTSRSYYREIRYRDAKCCYNCKHFIEGYFKYCRVHDNPVGYHKVCKYFVMKLDVVKEINNIKEKINKVNIDIVHKIRNE